MPKQFRSGTHEKPLDVVVVEDDADSRELLREALELAGFLVRPVADADEAMNALARRIPDVVVTDLVLAHGASGWTLAEALREQPETAEVALIAVSGRVEPDWRIVRAFDAYLRKPIDLDVLSRLVAQLGGRARTARAAQALARRG